MFPAHLAAAARVLARRDQRKRMLAAACFHQLDEEVGQLQRLGAQRRHAGLREHVQPTFDHCQRRDRLRAAQEAAHAFHRAVLRLHRKRRGVAPPA
ncbi:hypothetical protein FQZ97_677620 [compost metagenome]